MSIKTIIGNLRWWAFYCDKTPNGCYAAQTLYDVASFLEKLKARLEEEAAREVCRFCGAEKCVGRDNCPSITEWVRRVTDGE